MAKSLGFLGLTAAHKAALDPDANFLKTIKKLPKQANSDGALLHNTPLFCACGCNNVNAVEWYIKHQPETLTAENGLGFSPLQWAIEAGVERNQAVIDLLLVHMDDFLQADNLGNTVLHNLVGCLTWQSSEAVFSIIPKILAKAPELVNIENLAGLTPTQLADELGVVAPNLNLKS